MSTSLSDFLSTRKQGSKESGKLRPALYIGLGGVGVKTIVRIKTELTRLQSPMGGFGFLGLDTQKDGSQDLDSTQYIAMSVGADPQSIAANNAPLLKFYGEASGHYTARSITGGANAVRLVGRVAFRNPTTLDIFKSSLETILNEIKKPKEGFSSDVPAVSVIASVAGGTGSGCLQDALVCAGSIAKKALGADFFYQAILVLPDVLEGEATLDEMPRLYANAYATLRDLYHFMTTGEDKWEDYGNALRSIKLDRTLLPSLVYLIGDKNEDGTPLFAKIDELTEVASQFLLSKVLCPEEAAGGADKREGENYNDPGPGNQGMPRVFSSFGHLRAGLLREPLGEYLGARLVRDVLQMECGEGSPAFQDASAWISANQLAECGADQLQEALKQTSNYDRGTFAVDPAGHLSSGKLNYGQIKQSCEKFQEGCHTNANFAEWVARLEKAKKTIAKDTLAQMSADYERRAREAGAGAAAAFVTQLKQQIHQHEEALLQEAAAKKTSVDKVGSAIKDVFERIDEARKGWVGRTDRVASLLREFGTRLSRLLEMDAELRVMNTGLEVYKELASALQFTEHKAVARKDSLAERKSAMERRCVEAGQKLNSLYDVSKRGAGNQLSLVDAKGAEMIYGNQLEQQKASSYPTCRESLRNANLLDSIEPFEAWFDKALSQAKSAVVDAVLDKVDLASYLENYLDDKTRAGRLGQIKALATPLFWLDPNARESYSGSWLIGVNPAIRQGWETLCGPHLGNDTRDFTYYESRGDMALYKITRGYTLHSLKSLDNYRGHYWRKAESFRRNTWLGKVAEPVDTWPEASGWEEPVPVATSTKAAARLFVLGRALNKLAPDKSKPGSGFIYEEKGKYFINLPLGGKLNKTEIGATMPQSLAQFSEGLIWQKAVKDEVDAAPWLDGTLVQRLETEFLPAMEGQMETLKSGQREEAFDEAEVLRTLKTALHDFLKEAKAASRKAV